MRFINQTSPRTDSVYYPELYTILKNFEKISLKQMDSVMLFDRVDMKFLFHVHELPALLKGMMDEYYTLEVLDTRIHTYHTLYYDTPDFVHYLRHHNLRKSRFKFRHRIYVESDLHFFEVKEKNNRDRTVKSRIMKVGKNTEVNESVSRLVEVSTPFSAEELQPKLWSNFHRITMVHKERQERMTIDLNLVFSLPGNENGLAADNLVILELKQEKKNFAIPLIRSLIERGIRPTGVSKYTMGVFNLYEDQKKNHFYPIQRTILSIHNTP